MSGFLRDLFASIAERRSRLRDDPGPDGGAGRLLDLARELISGRGEASGVALAEDFLNLYGRLEDEARTTLFLGLAEGFGPDAARLRQAASAYLEDGDPHAAVELQAASEPTRQELLRRLNLAPGGTAQLVSMREHLLERLRGHPKLAPVDADFVHLFSSWFNRGFLVLRRIDWHTPAAILEKIIHYEAVHRFHDWEDLRRRIDLPDRRLYAFFHPALTDEPLIFVQVALTGDIPEAIAPVLTVDREPISGERAATAVFYAITNTREGLRGISFGNFLIKQVVEELCREFPNLKRFVTLSPAPGFRAWLAKEIAVRSGFVAALGGDWLVAALADDAWRDDPEKASLMAPIMQALAAHYFIKARDPRGRVVDPVARFHLGNGARLERINWPADLSQKGLAQSHGLMVNYLYELKTIERNHEAFVNEGKVIAAPAVTRRLKVVREAEPPAALAASPTP